MYHSKLEEEELSMAIQMSLIQEEEENAKDSGIGSLTELIEIPCALTLGSSSGMEMDRCLVRIKS